MLLMIPAWIFFPEIVFSSLWLWKSAENGSQQGESPKRVCLILGKYTQSSSHPASICWHFSGSHEVQSPGNLEMWKQSVHSSYPQPAQGSGTCKQTKDHSASWQMHWWRCEKSAIGAQWIGYIGLIHWRKWKWILGGVSERHWDIFWKSRKILITKLTGQNGSGQINKGGSWIPVLSRKWQLSSNDTS